MTNDKAGAVGSRSIRISETFPLSVEKCGEAEQFD